MRKTAGMLLGAAALLVGVPGGAAAQVTGLQVGRLDHVATTLTATVTMRQPLRSRVVIPKPGDTGVVKAADWILLVGGGAGVSLGAGHGIDDNPTLTAELGVLRRLPTSLPDGAGLVGVVVFEPVAAGPAVRVEAFQGLDVEAGGLWHDNDLGFRWFVSMGVSAAFLKDVFGGLVG